MLGTYSLSDSSTYCVMATKLDLGSATVNKTRFLFHCLQVSLFHGSVTQGGQMAEVKSMHRRDPLIESQLLCVNYTDSGLGIRKLQYTVTYK